MKIKLDSPGKVNEIRSVKKYAWLPKVAHNIFNDDKYIIWLQPYVQQQKYLKGLHFYGWTIIKNYI